MQPLLSITRVPINIEYRTQRAELQYSGRKASVEVSRQRGRANIQTNPAQIKMDSYETRASMGIKTAPRLVQEHSDAGKQAGMNFTRTSVENRKQMVNSLDKEGAKPIIDIIRAKSMNTTQTIMAFIPSVRPQMWVEGGDISFDYSMDQLHFDWDAPVRPEMDYVPGGIEFAVTQQPQVIIEYLGGPMYVPPSADPDYVPPPELDAGV